MKHSLFIFLISVVILVTLMSCNTNSVYDKYKPIPEAEWHKDSLVIFNIPVDDTAQSYNLLINVRNEMDYNFSNLWLFIEMEKPGGKTLKDTFEITLAAPSGKWLGEGFGGLKTRQVMYLRNYNFSEPGEYTVKIQQGMRKDVLTGIKDVGFSVEKAES
ncbi:MAG: gliding motility lipoprotein GldH [Prolixibacteraceae bacterium]